MHWTVGDWAEAFSEVLGQRDFASLSYLFAEDCYWRDILAFTWDLRTIEGPAAITSMLVDRLPQLGDLAVRLDDQTDARAAEGFVEFETAIGRGRGYVRLKDGVCYTLLTVLEELKGFEERKGARRAIGSFGDASGNWRSRLETQKRELGVREQPYVVVVGGGQGGLALAARLRQLDVPTIVVDRFARSGDQWRRRYASLSLHDPVWIDHLPYLPFPDTWPIFTPKDKLADWLESYETLMELNVWHSTECLGASYAEDDGCWAVEVLRDGEKHVLRPTHLVLAMGNSGKPIQPSFAGMERFGGPQWHSADFPGGQGMAGKRVVVIGSNNSAHDICGDLVAHDASATMVQRSSTFILRQEALVETFGKLYSEEALARGMTTDRADLVSVSMPLRLLPKVHQPAVAALRERDKAFYASLNAVGFMLDFGEDDTGLAGKYMRRASGYYIDVGASSLVATGKIGLRSNVQVDEIEEGGVRLSTGELLPADAIVYATGYGSMDQRVADLISPEVARKVGKVWGYGSDTRGDPGPWEGELRNMWKPTAQPGLWFHGGSLTQSRFYSLALALQLKARQEGLPVEVYTPPASGG